MLKCEFCNLEIKNNKGSLVNHQNRCSLNPNRKIIESNFIKYNQKIKNGELVKVNSNHIVKAKNDGKPYEITDETRKKISDKLKGRIISKEQKEKLSKYRSKILEELGVGGFQTIKWYSLKNINNQEFIVRGKWELQVGELLNKNQVLWVRKIYIPYTDFDGINRTYTPDFYIPSLDRYLEVKGYFSEKDKNKLKLVVEQNKINILVIQGGDLNNELINNIIAPISPLSYTQ